jgi:hypothetical protein
MDRQETRLVWNGEAISDRRQEASDEPGHRIIIAKTLLTPGTPFSSC